MYHLMVRVPWHDSQWNGTVCSWPSGNPYCPVLDRIRQARDDAREDALQGKHWSEVARGRRWLDFSFVDPGGGLILWEHLGMLDRADYQDGWKKKQAWYAQNGYLPDQNLFTPTEDERGGLDSIEVRSIAEKIQSFL